MAIPIGKPFTLMPAFTVMPGIPALLPGSALRMKVARMRETLTRWDTLDFRLLVAGIILGGSVAKFLNDRAGSVILNLFMKLTNKIAAPDVIGHCPSIDLCGSCA